MYLQDEDPFLYNRAIFHFHDYGRKGNMAPVKKKRAPKRKPDHLPTNHFQGKLAVKLRGVYLEDHPRTPKWVISPLSGSGCGTPSKWTCTFVASKHPKGKRKSYSNIPWALGRDMLVFRRVYISQMLHGMGIFIYLHFPFNVAIFHRSCR